MFAFALTDGCIAYAVTEKTDWFRNPKSYRAHAVAAENHVPYYACDHVGWDDGRARCRCDVACRGRVVQWLPVDARTKARTATGVWTKATARVRVIP